MSIAVLAALTTSIATNELASNFMMQLNTFRDANCPQIPRVQRVTDFREVTKRKYEIEFDDTAAFHFSVNGNNQIKKFSPDGCNPKQRLAVTAKRVEQINQEKGLSWKAWFDPEKHGRTADSYGTGLVRPEMQALVLPPDEGAGPRRQLSPPSTTSAAISVPVAYDARDLYAGQTPCKAFNVLDQGQCGSCYAHAAASSFGARMCRTNPNSLGNVGISPQQLMDCTTGCSGGYTESSLQVLVSNGGVESWCDPYTQMNGQCNATCTTGLRSFAAAGSVKTVTSVAVMQYELLKYGPGGVMFNVYTDFYGYQSGVYQPSASAVVDGGHAVSLIGWGVDNGVPYWLCQNSWGASWGEGGYFRIQRGANTCGIESTGLSVARPKTPSTCANAGCANGAVTMADCTCRCDNGLTGVRCDVCPSSGCPPNATVTAEMTARLTASQPVISSIIAEADPSIWIPGADNSSGVTRLWVGGSASICYMVPALMNSNPKSVKLVQGGGYYTGSAFGNPAIPADASGCFGITLASGLAIGKYTIVLNPFGVSLAVDLGRADGYLANYKNLPTANPPSFQFLPMWNVDAAHASIWDKVQVVSAKNSSNVVGWVYTSTKSQTPPNPTTAVPSLNAYASIIMPYANGVAGGYNVEVLPGGGPLKGWIKSTSWVNWASFWK